MLQGFIAVREGGGYLHREVHTMSCEELETVIFSSDPEKYFKIGRELSRPTEPNL
jgi:hypothetical protein